MDIISVYRLLKLYKKMYYRLFNAVTDIINKCDDCTVKENLIKAQLDAEEMYVSADVLVKGLSINEEVALFGPAVKDSE